MQFLHKLYLVRFSVLAILFLIFFSAAVFVGGFAKPLLAGLFDLPDPLNVFWCAFFAYTLSWTATTTMKLTLLYGEQRFGITGNWINKIRFHQALFWCSCLFPLFLLWGVAALNKSNVDRGQIFGAVGGAAVAFLLLFAVDIIQRLLNSYQKGRISQVEKNFLIPFSARFFTELEEQHAIFRFNEFVFRLIDKVLRKIPASFRRGYVQESDEALALYAGHILALVMSLVFLLIYAAGFVIWFNYDRLHSFSFGITSISYLLILLTLLCWVMAATAFFWDYYRIPTLLVILVGVWFAELNHTYEIRPLKQDAAVTPKQIVESRKDSPYLILVAANGGGIQAAAWTAQVLSELQTKCRDFDPRVEGCANSIALISSVSGGSVGTMFFVNAYDNSSGIDGNKLPDVVEHAKTSSLDYVAGGLVYADLVRNVYLFDNLFFHDRGKALEKSWKDRDPGLDKSLSDWAEGVRQGKRPAVIFNSTVAETGERMLFANTKLSNATVCADEQLKKAHGWKGFHELFPGKDLQIATAARLSASFPFVSPAAKMAAAQTDQERFHFVDGGYYDNYGISSLLDWLDEALCSTDKPPKILIVQIIGDKVFKGHPVDDAQDQAANEQPVENGQKVGGEWFEQTFIPLKTILGVRTTGQLSRNESELEMFQRYWRRENRVQIERVVFEYSNGSKGEQAPLSWHLTKDDQNNIRTVWEESTAPGGKNAADLQKFLNFIK